MGLRYWAGLIEKSYVGLREGLGAGLGFCILFWKYIIRDFCVCAVQSLIHTRCETRPKMFLGGCDQELSGFLSSSELHLQAFRMRFENGEGGGCDQDL